MAADQSAMWNASADLAQAWSVAEQRAATPAHSHLEKRHSAAIYMFTRAVGAGGRTVVAVTEGSQQQLGPESPALFSHLSEAIQILKHSQRLCHATSYAADLTPSSLNASGKLLRFGAFVLGSGGRRLRGNARFEVHTCFGADVTPYSASRRNSQVLIPPYEVFRVADGRSDPRRGGATYRLESDLHCVYDRRSGSLRPISASSASLPWVVFGAACIGILFLLLTLVIYEALKARMRGDI